MARHTMSSYHSSIIRKLNKLKYNHFKMYIGKSHAKHAYTSHIYCCASASPTEVCPSPDATPYARYHAVRVHLRAPTSTHTEFYQLAHNTNTSRCKMCNTGSKCKFENKSCFRRDLAMTSHLSIYQRDRIASLLEEGKSISQIVMILESEG